MKNFEFSALLIAVVLISQKTTTTLAALTMTEEVKEEDNNHDEKTNLRRHLYGSYGGGRTYGRNKYGNRQSSGGYGNNHNYGNRYSNGYGNTYTKNCFLCPKFSAPKHGLKYGCAQSFDDCHCIHGYWKDGYQCIEKPPPCYQCPKHSYLKSEYYCSNNFDDCDCEYGFVKDGYKCVLPCYDCPAYSSRKSIGYAYCTNSFSDCVCDYGFERRGHGCVCPYGFELSGNQCVKKCFNCPAYSYLKYDKLSCSNSFHDCDCDYGFEKKGQECVCPYGFEIRGGQCVKKRIPCYKCPAYSYLKYDQLSCTNSFHDCDCDYGFEKKGHECVCPYGFEIRGNECVQKRIPCYKCPAYSYLKYDELSCYGSFDDCACDSGYYKKGGSCVLY